MDYCAFLLERHEPHGIPSTYGHSCMVCANVCLTVMSSFSDITKVSPISHNLKTNSLLTLLLHVMQYDDDNIGQKLKLDENCPVGNGS